MTELQPKPLVIRDELHGDMVFPHPVRAAIDHEYFQRLRSIKQMGLAEFVFPCASHSRFQHSLGAAFLAGQYFQNVLESWSSFPFTFDGQLGRTQFFARRTFDCVRAVTKNEESKRFWLQVMSLAGLLHDVGHGPWSHTFEYLELEGDFQDVTRSITGPVGHYFANREATRGAVRHEDLSVIYIFQILKDLEARNLFPGALKYFLPVTMLVNRKMGSGADMARFETQLKAELDEQGIEGGVEFHRLMRPLISGPLDIDRTDYIQRDARNCGVSMGGIEWRRIMSKVVPCLAEHENNDGEPREVILVSNVKNQHILDDFVFSRFQMYAQVYLHPKIVGLEEIIRGLLARRSDVRRGKKITFETHRQLTDEKFREMLKNELGVPEIDDLLIRKQSSRFQVTSYPPGAGMEDSLRKQGFQLIESLDRPMIKDRFGVFLYTPNKPGIGGGSVSPWAKVSPLAQQFNSTHYEPNIWFRL